MLTGSEQEQRIMEQTTKGPFVGKPEFRYRDFGLINFRHYLERFMDPRELVASCITCEHFNHEMEGCKIAGGQRPPAKVIAFGCPSYKDNDDIPF